MSIFTVSVALAELPALSVTEHVTTWTPSPLIGDASLHVGAPLRPLASLATIESATGACTFQPLGDQPLMRRLARGLAKGMYEIAARKVAGARDLGDRHAAVDLAAQHFLRPCLL